MTPPRPEVDAVGLSAEHLHLWIRTVLAVTGTEPQRRAFIDGYNGQPVPRHPSQRMWDQHALGKQVFAILDQEKGNG